jgi:hypothetical protein
MVILVWHPHDNQLHTAHSDPQLYCAYNPAETNTMYVSLLQYYDRIQYCNQIVMIPSCIVLAVLQKPTPCM